jgi:hypothetical protein
MTDFKGVCGSQELRQTQKIGCQTGKLQAAHSVSRTVDLPFLELPLSEIAAYTRA